MNLSVIICAYNPDRQTFLRVLGGLEAQTLSRDEWELLLVDNGSTPSLDSWVDASWHPRARIVKEGEKGVALARGCGIRESRGDVILFVDDDTILDSSYLETAIRLLDQYPFIGVLGGYGRAEFQGTLEPWMEDFSHMYLEFRNLPDRQYEIQFARTYTLGPWIPPTAGVAVRRPVATYFADRLSSDPFLRGLGRKGKGEILVGSEDEDLALCAVDLGMASGMTSLMKYTHVVPSWRLTKTYLTRLLYAANYGTACLLVHRGLKKAVTASPPNLFSRVRGWIAFLRRRDPAAQCWHAFSRGYYDGLSGKPFDTRYV